jgi:hypothetical protein
MPTIVLDSRIERAQVASLHRFFLESNQIDLTKSGLGRLVFDTLYTILKDNGYLKEMSDSDAQFYLADHFSSYKLTKKRPSIKIDNLSKSLPTKGEDITNAIAIKKPNQSLLDAL